MIQESGCCGTTECAYCGFCEPDLLDFGVDIFELRASFNEDEKNIFDFCKDLEEGFDEITRSKIPENHVYDFEEFLSKLRVVGERVSGRIKVFLEAQGVTLKVADILSKLLTKDDRIYWTIQLERHAKEHGRISLYHDISEDNTSFLNDTLRDVFGERRVKRSMIDESKTICIKLARIN